MFIQAQAASEVLSELDRRRALDPDVHGSSLFGLIYPTGRADIEQLINDVYDRYLFANALNPLRFGELARIEREVISMAADLVHRPDSGKSPGAVTSGGTESILMSMLVAREKARARGVAHPTILAPQSAHPAYAKAAHYFNMGYERIELDDKYRADPASAQAQLTSETAVIVANAYSYPHGAMDPVSDLAAIAGEAGIACHVDACIGGFILPYLELLGREIPAWDFRVEGVTQLSMDAHKYAYVPKGASVVLYRDDDWGWLQTFFYEQWGSGLYATAAMAGARSPAAIVALWALSEYLGTQGYSDLASDLVVASDQFRTGVAEIEHLAIVGEPVGPLFALTSDTVDLYAVSEAMEKKGWFLNRNTDPKGLHLMLSPIHRKVMDQLLHDLAECMVHHEASTNPEARYA
jgi:glutamate/tyrosine decarboxylase-like PLP-dependent enzyme